MEAKNAGKGQFFSVSFYMLLIIAESGGGADELNTYLTLARGAGKYQSSGWTENAVADRLRISYSKVTKAFAWLEERQFINMNRDSQTAPNTSSVDAVATKTNSRFKHKWRIAKSEGPRLYLPNSLIDGIGKGKDMPPLARLYGDVATDIAVGITAGMARLDAVMLLLTLYRNHDLELFGGVDPAIWHQKWAHADPFSRDAEYAIRGTNLVIKEIKRGNSNYGNELLALPHFRSASQEVRQARLSLAMRNIRSAGLVYDVLTVWTANPVDDLGAEVMYPLYIFDGRARNSKQEPTLYRKINAIAMKAFKEAYGRKAVFDDDGALVLNEGDFFRYIEPCGANAKALSVLHLRYRPNDRDTGHGMLEQKRRVEDWGRVLSECLLGSTTEKSELT